VAKQRAVLVSSHAVADLEPLAGRVVVLRKGVVVADAAPAELCTQTAKTKLEDAVVALLDEPEAETKASA
jgi:ABC-type Na+ transport system ATPase subunit NatA